MFLQRSLLQSQGKVIDISDAYYKKVVFSVVLSIFPGMGQVFSGELYRGIIAYLGLIYLSWFVAFLILRVESIYLSLLLISLPFIYAFAVCVDAAFCAIHNSTVTKQSKSRQITNFSLFILLFICVNTMMDYLVGKHIVRAFFVTSTSMQPNIFKHDFILIDKISEPSKNDIVLIDFNENKSSSTISNILTDQTLRRIVATEGDEVKIVGRQLYINNLPVEENYIINGSTQSHNIYTYNGYQWGPMVVPKESYFVLSDSRQYGFDSRTFGMINKNYINGIARKVLWSWNLDKGNLKWDRTALAIK